MNSDHRNAASNSIQAWVEVIEGNATTKGTTMRDESTQKMSEETADILFGQSVRSGVGVADRNAQPSGDFDRDLYELQKLADQMLTAVAAKGAQDVAFREAGRTLPYQPPRLKFFLPMPPWPK